MLAFAPHNIEGDRSNDRADDDEDHRVLQANREKFVEYERDRAEHDGCDYRDDQHHAEQAEHLLAGWPCTCQFRADALKIIEDAAKKPRRLQFLPAEADGARGGPALTGRDALDLVGLDDRSSRGTVIIRLGLAAGRRRP